MRLKTLSFVLLCIVFVATAALAEDAVQDSSKILIKPVCANSTNRNYKVDVAVKGTVPVPDSKELVNVDSSLSLIVNHKYTRRGEDGLMPLEVSVTKGEAVIRDKAENFEQKMDVAPGTYPKLTVLLDSNCHLTDIYGIVGTQYAQGMSGLNYSNVIVLFLPDMGGQARGVGDKWESKITIPSYKETYSFVNTLKSIDPVAKTAVIAQEISWNPSGDKSSTVKATALSTYSTDDGKLIKSHAECRNTLKGVGDSKESASSKQEPTPGQTNISLDVTLIENQAK